MDAPTRALRPPDATAPDTAFPDAATRHEPPDAPRSGKELSRVHPEQNALSMAAPMSSPPRRKSRTGRRAPAARPRPSHAPSPTALPCNAALGTAETGLPRLCGQGCSARLVKRLSGRSGQLPHLVQRRSDRPTGKEKRRDSLSLTKRWPEAEGDEQCGKCPPPRARPGQHRRFPRASGTSSIGSRPQNARRVRREFHKLFREPFQRLAPARLSSTFTPRRHWGTTAPAPRIVKKYSCV